MEVEKKELIQGIIKECLACHPPPLFSGERGEREESIIVKGGKANTFTPFDFKIILDYNKE